MRTIFILFISVALIPFGLSVYGLFLAFKASLVLGVLALILEPAPLVLGIIGVLGNPELTQQIANWLGLP